METCEICVEKAKDSGLVYYSEYESYLCVSHYREWLKVSRAFEKKHGDTSGNSTLCDKMEKVYIKWLKDKNSEGVG